MATNEETLYENMKNVGQKPVVENQTSGDLDDGNMKKRFVALGGAILGGGLTGATLASILNPTSDDDESEDVFKIIDESSELSFEEAFNDAREQLGPGGAFRWHGGVYNTYTEEEWKNLSQEERDAYNEKVRPLLTDEDQMAENYHHVSSGHSEHIQATKTVYVRHHEDFDIEKESLTELDGQTVIMATGTHNGNPMVLIDMDRNGTYDIMVEDSNGDDKITDNEYIDIRDQHVAVGNQSLVHADIRTVSDEWSILEEGETEMEGQKVIVAVANHNGQRAVLIDANRDGSYDLAIEDRNHDGKVSEDEMYDVSSRNLTVQDQNLVTGHLANNEDPVVEVDYSTEARIAIDEEGNEAIGAVGTVDGKPAVLMDVNRDGTYDRAMIKDGETLGQPINIASANARVHDMSLVDDDYYLDNQDDSTSDYVHKLSESENETVETEKESNEYEMIAQTEETVSSEQNEAVIEDYNNMAFADNGMTESTDSTIDDYASIPT